MAAKPVLAPLVQEIGFIKPFWVVESLILKFLQLGGMGVTVGLTDEVAVGVTDGPAILTVSRQLGLGSGGATSALGLKKTGTNNLPAKNSTNTTTDKIKGSKEISGFFGGCSLITSSGITFESIFLFYTDFTKINTILH